MKPVLKYLFEAQFTDGTIFKQTSSDISVIDSNKSQYYDLLQIVRNGKKIRLFSLTNDETKVSVDLVTGMFLINGLHVLLESEKVPTMPEKFDLIFYRQWTQDQIISARINDQLQPEITKIEPKDPFCEYFIGWECEINGKKYTQKLAVT